MCIRDSLGMANLLLPDNPPNPEFLQGEATGPILAHEIGKILDDPNSVNLATKSSRQLHQLLGQPNEQGAVDWLVQEGRLG